MGRPVAMATARAGMLRDELVKTAEQLGGQLARAVEEMRILTDPDAAAAQVETVAAEAAQQVAAAEVARNRAEATARHAKSNWARPTRRRRSWRISCSRLMPPGSRPIEHGRTPSMSSRP